MARLLRLISRAAIVESLGILILFWILSGSGPYQTFGYSPAQSAATTSSSAATGRAGWQPLRFDWIDLDWLKEEQPTDDRAVFAEKTLDAAASSLGDAASDLVGNGVEDLLAQFD